MKQAGTPLSRRSLLAGLATAIAAPAVIRTPELLMPVRTIAQPDQWFKVVGSEDVEFFFRGSLLARRRLMGIGGDIRVNGRKVGRVRSIEPCSDYPCLPLIRVRRPA